jgi:hypothetical protein
VPPNKLSPLLETGERRTGRPLAHPWMSANWTRRRAAAGRYCSFEKRAAFGQLGTSAVRFHISAKPSFVQLGAVDLKCT